jgi:hypothetical protein
MNSTVQAINFFYIYNEFHITGHQKHETLYDMDRKRIFFNSVFALILAKI